MKRVKEVFRPRGIDRALFAILAALHVANGLYLVGPWYLDQTDSTASPLIAMFDNSWGVATYGTLLLVDGLALMYVAATGSSRTTTFITENALLAGFLLRLYSLIGVLVVVESWRPPAYLSHISTVAALGAYWVWVKVSVRNVRPIS